MPKSTYCESSGVRISQLSKGDSQHTLPARPWLKNIHKNDKQTMQLFLLLLNEVTTLQLDNASALAMVYLHVPNQPQFQFQWINSYLGLWASLALLISIRCNNAKSNSDRRSSNDRSNISSSGRISRRWETRKRNGRGSRRTGNFDIP
jgi:hypothetical protein